MPKKNTLLLSEGVRLMLISAFLYAVLNALVKDLGGRIPAVEVVFFRAIISLAMSVVLLRRQKIPMWGNNKPVLLLRGVLGTLALILLFTTYQKMRLATATTIHYLSPIFTILIATVVLKERLHRLQILFFLISFLGVVFIRGFDDQINPFYLGIGIVSAFLAGGAYNCIRYLRHTEHPLVIVLYFPFVAMPVAGLASYYWAGWVMPEGVEWLKLLGIGVCTQVAQVMMTKAYQQAASSAVAGVTYSGIIYAILFGVFIFGESYKWVSYLGIGIVMLGVILNVLFPTLRKKRKK